MSGQTITLNRGTAAFTAAASKFGTNGLAGGVYYASNSPNAFSGFFGAAGAIMSAGTIEGWVKTTATSIRVAFGQASTAWVGIAANGTAVGHYGTPDLVLSSTKVINDGAWHHVALVLIGNGLGALYADGALIASATATSIGYVGTANSFGVGGMNLSGTTYDWAGQGSGVIDEVRVSTIARYSGSTYTVPTAAFTPDTNTWALWHLEADGTDSGTTVAPATPYPTITSTGGVDTISYAAVAAGTNPVAGYALYAGVTSGSESATPVATNTGSGAGSFTYTPSSATGYYIVRALDNAATPNYSGPSTEIYSATTATIVPTDPSLVFSPYTWDVTAARALCINGGYFSILLRGASVFTVVKLFFDISVMASSASRIAYRFDRLGGWNEVVLSTGTVSLTIPSASLGWPSHFLEVVVKTTTENANRWASPYPTGVKLTSITVSPAATVEAPTKAALNGLFFGDSITEGINTLNASGDTTARSDTTQSWAYEQKQILGSEVGVVGFGGQGLAVQGTSGSVPVFPSTWAYIASGIARAFTPTPDFIWINQGTNDSRNSVTAAVFQTALTSVLNAMLAVVPSTVPIFVQLPFGGYYGTAVYQAAIAATSSPKRITFVDTTGWWSSGDSVDALHPYGYINSSKLAPLVARAIRAGLGKGAAWTKRTDGTLKQLTYRKV